MSKQIITMTIDADLIKYLEDLASANHRSRSGMMEQLIREELERDQIMDEYARRCDDGQQTDI